MKHAQRQSYRPGGIRARLADGNSAAPVKTALSAVGDLVAGCASAGPDPAALRARENAVQRREAALQRREMRLLQRERQLAARERGMRKSQLAGSAHDELHARLQQANEHLEIASVRSQSLAAELEQSKAAIGHWTQHDFLTSLPNRMQLYDRIAQAIALARRHHTGLALLIMDLDRFKSINDTLGHAIGDQLLQAVAQRLKGATRSTDTVSRQGGDEFVLLLFEVGQQPALTLHVEKIHQIVTAPYEIGGNRLHIGATIGVSVFPQDGEDTETLIRHADDAVYYAKEVARNNYQFFNQEMRAREIERQQLEASLYQALELRQFVLFYQAQVDLESGAIVGAEALIRWRHASRGLLLPSGFVPAAEDCGAIVPIGRWVLREACRQAQSWLDDGLQLNVIAVNISAREFENDDFPQHVRAVLAETGLAPHHLELELTETVLMKSIECTALTLHDLRSIGVRISIDDFGTGYSSLSYLKRFPVDTMKIDQSFVRDISAGADDVLVNAVIGIGKNLRHQVIAEGVETPTQLAFLRENQCSAVQGFYLNRPMVAEEFVGVLRHGVAPHLLN